MEELKPAWLGIRGKLNLGVGIVVLVSAFAFGGLYALVERAAILGGKQDHLVHVASMAKLAVEGTDGSELRQRIERFSQHLSEATGARHQIRIEDHSGRLLAGGGSRALAAEDRLQDGGIWSDLSPSTMTGEVSILMGPRRRPERLIVEESLRNLPSNLRTLFMRHFAFAAVLFGLTAFCTSLLAHLLIVRPVRELAAATGRIGTSGGWEPFSPTIRRRDEVGVLCDRFAALSRRLFALVRDERYDSAHLVAVGVERGLEEPIRHVEMELALLQASLPAGSDELQRCASIAGHLDEIVEVSHRLRNIGINPASAEA